MSVVDQQLRSNDCGISAIKTVFNIFDREIDRNYIQSKIHLDEQGSSLRDIKTFLDENGCTTAFKFLDVGLLSKDLSSLKSLFPFIFPIKKSDRIHYVVVNGIRGDKLKLYDPSRLKPYYLTFGELRSQMHFSASYWKLVDFKERMEALCAAELSNYDISLKDTLVHHQDNPINLFNKLVYFAHLRDNYGFKNERTEKTFLQDVLNGFDLSTMPKQFRQIKYEKEKVRLSAPLALCITSITKEKIKTEVPPEDTNIYGRLIKELGTNRKLWHIYLFTALFAASVTQCTVFISQILIDYVLPSFQLTVLTLFAIGFGMFRIFNLIISQYKYFVSIHVGNILDKYFLVNFNEKLNNFSLRYAQTFRRGDLTERLSDSMKLKSFFLHIFSRIMVDLFVSVYSLGLLVYINAPLSLLVCVVMVLFYLWFRIITPYLKANEKKRFIIKADFISRMIEKIDGNQVIKSFRLEGVFSNKIVKSIRELVDIQTRTKYVDQLNSGVISLVSTVAYTVIVIVMARESIVAQSLTFGQLITFIMLSERVFSTLSRILEENLTLQENEIILRRYFDFNDPQLATQSQTKGIRDFSIESISVQNLSFGYNPQEPVLKDVSFSVKKGEKVKIEGGNGSGKSSLSKILSFLYNPDQGDIIINDTKSTFFDRDELRSKILLVTNEDLLFNETIEFNITFGRDIPHARILELAKEIDFYDFIAQHEEGLNYTINENGKNLSTGQRKKTLIMRALLSDAELVILDEVLSGIDVASREKIETLIAETTERTFIVISHEPVRHMEFDKAFLLTKGELAYA
jgi:ATP-binding cassette, subfamily B, bacterial HlyB/CyaB